MVRVFGKHIEISLEGDSLPTEFRILRAGLNESTNGPVLFDQEAARAVMAAYEAHGVRLVIDLQHDSINEDAIAHRSDAADARGECDIEVREGDLWGFAATWTPDGRTRLVNRTQRFLSPVVFCHPDTHRAEEIFNLALVAQPALHHMAPLVASRSIGESMDPEIVKEALEALIAGDADACAEILKKLIAGEDAAPEDGESEALKEAPESSPDDEEEDKEKAKEKDMAAMSVALKNALNVGTSRDVIAEVKRMRAELDALSLSRSADEHNERLALVGELVKLGAELPATAWADAEGRVPSDILAGISMVALRSRVEMFRAAPQVRAYAAPPRGGAPSVALLSDSERARAELIENPAARARFVASRMAIMNGATRG